MNLKEYCLKNKCTPLLIDNNVKFTRLFSWLFWLIKKFSKSRFNHAVCVLNINNNLFVIDANIKGVSIRPFDVWYNKEHRRYAILKIDSRFNETALINSFLNKTNMNYQYNIYILYILKLLFKIKPKHNNSYYCFELIADVYNIKSKDIYTANNFTKYIVSEGECL